MKTAPTEELPAYEVIRSKRKTADVVVERDGRVIVRAPEWVDDARVARIVRDKALWIHKNLADWRELNAGRTQREFKNGETFLYLGRNYRLRWTDEVDTLTLKNGRFLMPRPLASNPSAEAAAAFEEFYIARGRTKIPERIARFAPAAGVRARYWKIRDLGHRWAGCTPLGELLFHWKCMMAPLSIIDYIVVHELCHFHHSDHSEAFWNEVDKILPDYRERKEWLRKNGARLS